MESKKQYEGIADDSLGTYKLSVWEKKYAVIGISFCFLITLIIFACIAEACINQHPVFEFLQYDAFKPQMTIYGSISLAIFYLSIFILAIVPFSLLLSGFRWKKILLIPIIIGLSTILCSFVLMFISYDWHLKYSSYRYTSFILLAIGSVGQLSVLSIKYIINRTKDSTSINTVDFKGLAILLKFPFHVLLLIGMIINVVYFL